MREERSIKVPDTVDDLIFANLPPIKKHVYRLLKFHADKVERWAGKPEEVEFLSDYETRVLLEELNKDLGIDGYEHWRGE